MFDLFASPWPWYVAGPIIGLFVPALLLFGGKQFGISANLRHMCAAALPTRASFFQYDWKSAGLWNLVFLGGVVIGGMLAVTLLTQGSTEVVLADATVETLRGWGLTDLSGLVPPELVSWSALGTPVGALLIVGGGFLVGFGARWAGGCTSGHAISGLADLQFPSLVAVVGFFVGGLFVTHVLLPALL